MLVNTGHDPMMMVAEAGSVFAVVLAGQATGCRLSWPSLVFIGIFKEG